MPNSLTVYAPASIGNFSVGFDALGLALAPMDGTLLGDLVQLRPFSPREQGGNWKLELNGPFADALPADQEENVVIESCRAFQQAAIQAGVEIERLQVLLSTRLQICSGMVYIARSIVAAIEAFNRFHGNPLKTRQFVGFMARR